MKPALRSALGVADLVRECQCERGIEAHAQPRRLRQRDFSAYRAGQRAVYQVVEQRRFRVVNLAWRFDA